MMAAFCDDRAAAAGVELALALARSMSASVRPAPKAPILRKLRRLMPSQKRCLAPQMVSIESPLKKVFRTLLGTSKIVTGPANTRNGFSQFTDSAGALLLFVVARCGLIVYRGGGEEVVNAGTYHASALMRHRRQHLFSRRGRGGCPDRKE